MMNFVSISILSLFISAAVAAATSAVSDESPTAYELLQSYNFPPGLLPKGVTHYDLNNSTGEFHAYLNGTCSFSLEGSYQLKYKSTIGGKIGKNRLSNLSGVSVKVFFVWLNIVEVVRDGDDISLSVGIASADFPVENFVECPQCGCGMDCGGTKMIRLRKSGGLVSSIWLGFTRDQPYKLIVDAQQGCCRLIEGIQDSYSKFGLIEGILDYYSCYLVYGMAQSIC